ncbi:hypothetical protein PAESOLCIP111_01249 [Paenibacillus solanacearum]|uniref:Uncharacterized protein n=1 Tax=Paenibacillus solanacearum TaxID=2048548 RepID=A0A916NNV1_9BACL|nr:hypothetical protein [Paenibacillus solanacearum]CAG7610501.1 hypothetical protein PAESOLCIP111_01249 [Paenibacillus solanacearum]
MKVSHEEKEKHLKMVYRNNVIVARDGEKIIVVHSKRSIKPLLPFEISQQVFEQWKRRDDRIAVTETPYKELFAIEVHRSDTALVCVTDFNEIEFSEH